MSKYMESRDKLIQLIEEAIEKGSNILTDSGWYEEGYQDGLKEAIEIIRKNERRDPNWLVSTTKFMGLR